MSNGLVSQQTLWRFIARNFGASFQAGITGNPFLEASFLCASWLHKCPHPSGRWHHHGARTLMSIYFVFNIQCHKRVKKHYSFNWKVPHVRCSSREDPPHIKMANYLFSSTVCCISSPNPHTQTYYAIDFTQAFSLVFVLIVIESSLRWSWSWSWSIVLEKPFVKEKKKGKTYT